MTNGSVLAGPRATERDIAALAWIGEQYAVRMDTLTVLLGRRRGQPGRPGLAAAGPPLSVQTARAQVRRWEEAGWARRHLVLGQMWVLPTTAGLRLAGLREGTRTLSPWEPVATQLAHVHAVALVRLQLEERMEPGQTWICERYLRRETANSHRHTFDGAVELTDEIRVPFRNALGEWTARVVRPRAAIEVELTLKTPSRYRDLLTKPLGREWVQICYYAPALLVPILQRHLAADDSRCPVTVAALPGNGRE